MDWKAIDAGDQEWFVQHMPTALARRDAGYLVSLRRRWIEWVITGGIGLFGLLVLDWSALHAVMLLLITHWLGWLTDLVQWRLRAKALLLAYRIEHDDTRFWQLVAILRGKRRAVVDRNTAPPLGLSIAVDLVAGAVATVLTLQGLQRSGAELMPALISSSVVAAALLILAFGVLPDLRSRLALQPDGSVTLPVFRVGQRGIGLLVLVFGLMAAGGGTLAGSWLMGCVYGFFMLMGAIELRWGVTHAKAEIEWLRRERSGIEKKENPGCSGRVEIANEVSSTE